MTRDEALTEAIRKLACAIIALNSGQGVIYQSDVDYACVLAEEAIDLADNGGKP